MRAMRTLLRVSAILLFGVVASFAVAQDVDPARVLDDARKQIDDIRSAMDGKDVDDARLNQNRDSVGAIGAQADGIVNDDTPKLNALVARLSELGPAPAKGTSEPADIAAQRADLVKQRDALDAEIKRANVLSVESKQLAGAIAEERSARFQASLSQRTASPLSPAFWKNVDGNLARDGARLAALRDGVVAAVRDSFAGDNRVAATSGLGFGLFMIIFGRWWAERALMRLTADRVPQGRLRRSALAFAVVVVATAFTSVGAQAIAVGLNWHDAFSDTEQALAGAIIAAVFFGSFVAGLGRGLLSAARPSWRLPAIPDDVAQRLAVFPLLLGFAVAFGVLQRRVNSLVGASLSATIAGSLFVAIIYGGIFIGALLRAGRAEAGDGNGVRMRTRSAYVGIGIAILWIGVAVALLATAVG
jgi:potassium efflux system protein